MIAARIGKKNRRYLPSNRVSSWNLYTRGDDFYEALLQDVREARTKIWIEVYILETGPVGDPILNLLKMRAREGLDVRLLIDGVGSFWFPEERRQDLERAGCRVKVYQPIQWKSLRSLVNLNRRNHRKLMVIDDGICYLGGMNISCLESQKCSGESAWEDTMIRLTGDVVSRASESFLRTWNYGLNRWQSYLKSRHRRKAGKDPFQILEGVPLIPGTRSRFYFLRYLSRARNRVRIRTAYFVPGVFLLRKLRRLARKGVSVQILLNSKSDVPATLWASRAIYGTLLRAGVEIYERQKVFSHAKVTVIDGRTLFLGSSNLDTRSFLHNLEIDLFSREKSLAENLEEIFERELADSKRIQLQEYRERSRYRRFLEWFFFLFRYWL